MFKEDKGADANARAARASQIARVRVLARVTVAIPAISVFIWL